MPSQKLENILNLSLSSTPEQRARSGVLDVGFDPEEKTWELIVKYSGDLAEVRAGGIVVEELLAGYAIMTVPESLIEGLAALPQIEYVEMPKNLQNGLYAAKQESCILPLTGSSAASLPGGALTGEGVLVAVLDSGIDYYLPDFRNPDGTTRIAWLWDQTLDAAVLNARAAVRGAEEEAAAASGVAPGSAAVPSGEGVENVPAERLAESAALYGPPEGFAIGVEFSGEQIDAALATGSRESAFALIPSNDRSGHGTEVAAVAAGNNASPLLRGVATKATLLIVKLANRQTGFPRTTELMRGVQWALQKARQMGMPLVINLSFGNSYGPHDGSSLISRYLDNAAETGRTVICVGSGNEGASLGHAAGRLTMGPETEGAELTATGAQRLSAAPLSAAQLSAAQQDSSQRVELVVADYERTTNVQLWKNFADTFDILLQSPTGDRIPVLFNQTNRQQVRSGRTQILIYVGQPSPYSVHQEIFFDFLPLEDYIDAGVWTFTLTPRRIVTGVYQFYLPGQEARAPGTRFARATPELTLTIPSTSAKVITVGASNQLYDAYADFSGRGAPPFAVTENVFADTKPDLVAPGVDIQVPTAGGGTVRVSGTSFAAPLVTGAAAILMEWGILRGNDPYLYGEKMKAALRYGAKPLRGESEVPNERTGYGKLCAAGSITGIFV